VVTGDGRGDIPQLMPTQSISRGEDPCGDPRYLEGVQWCVEQRCKILGLYQHYARVSLGRCWQTVWSPEAPTGGRERRKLGAAIGSAATTVERKRLTPPLHNVVYAPGQRC
jgi:hypothetical protein